MVSCDVTFSEVAEQGEDAFLLYWTYVDDSSGQTIVPASHSEKLFNPNDSQRDPNGTSQTATGTFTATHDTDGSVTGTTDAFYVNVDFHQQATTGTWYVETTFTHEGVQKDHNVCVSVVDAGASVSDSSPATTPYTYCTPNDVQNWLLKLEGFNQNSLPEKGQITSYILGAEGEFEDRTGKAYRPVFVQHEIHDLHAWRERHREIFQNWFAVPRPVQLNHAPVLPFDAGRGHKIEVYEGSSGEISAAQPQGEWTDFLAEKTQGRNNDWWLDEQKGQLKVRKTFLFRRASLLRVSYEYGKPITTTSSTVSNAQTAIPCESTHRYETRGMIRIGDEYVWHTGKTQDKFTGCARAQLGTQASQHPANAEIVEVPDAVRKNTAMKAAADLLDNEEYVQAVPEGSNMSPQYQNKIQRWNERWREFMGQDHQRWTLL